MKGNEGPKGQNKRKSNPKRQTLENEKLQNLKGNGNFEQILARWSFWKVQKAKMKENEGHQNA